MADTIFEFVAEKLQQETDLDKLEARGTVRIGLKEAGLDARGVTKEQMAVMLKRTMPAELTARGIDRAEQTCESLIASLQGFDGGVSSDAESPEDVFRRLGGR